MISLASVFRHWFTGKDNHSYEVGRALWALTIVFGIGFTGIDIWFNKGRFNAVEYGTGLGSLLALGGAGIALKDRGVSVSTTPNGDGQC